MATNRDRVWTAVLELATHPGFTAHDVRKQIEGETPTDRSIRDALSSMEDLGILTGHGGEGSDPRKYTLGERTQRVMHDVTLRNIYQEPFAEAFSPEERVKIVDALADGLQPVSQDFISHFKRTLLSGEGTVKDEEGNLRHIEDAI